MYVNYPGTHINTHKQFHQNQFSHLVKVLLQTRVVLKNYILYVKKLERYSLTLNKTKRDMTYAFYISII